MGKFKIHKRVGTGCQALVVGLISRFSNWMAKTPSLIFTIAEHEIKDARLIKRRQTDRQTDDLWASRSVDLCCRSMATPPYSVPKEGGRRPDRWHLGKN